MNSKWLYFFSLNSQTKSEKLIKILILVLFFGNLRFPFFCFSSQTCPTELFNFKFFKHMIHQNQGFGEGKMHASSMFMNLSPFSKIHRQRLSWPFHQVDQKFTSMNNVQCSKLVKDNLSSPDSYPPLPFSRCQIFQSFCKTTAIWGEMSALYLTS